MYESHPKGMPVGLTDNNLLKVLVKRQLIKEATQAVDGAKVVGDEVLIAHFQSHLEELTNTLDMLIPPELEELVTGKTYQEQNDDR
jgi:hypothetical protein